MARDEALLNGSRTLVRRSAWERPSVTLGRFQEYCELEINGVRRPAVRRITGGGAILHVRECTVSFVAPTPSRPFPDRSPPALAQRAAEIVLASLRPWSAELRIRGGDARQRHSGEPADCFRRMAPSDLVVAAADGRARKVAGIALHRRRGRVLVQASIAREPLSLFEVDDGELLARIARALGAQSSPAGELSPDEKCEAERLLRERYARAEWNLRRAASAGVPPQRDFHHSSSR